MKNGIKVLTIIFFFVGVTLFVAYQSGMYSKSNKSENGFDSVKSKTAHQLEDTSKSNSQNEKSLSQYRNFPESREDFLYRMSEEESQVRLASSKSTMISSPLEFDYSEPGSFGFFWLNFKTDSLK